MKHRFIELFDCDINEFKEFLYKKQYILINDIRINFGKLEEN